MENKMPQPIILTGCARSGTSMVAGVMNICGAFGGKMFGGNRYNEKGMFENAYIRERIEKPYFKSVGVDILGQYPLPDVSTLPIPRNWEDQIKRVMKDEGYQQGAWMYKDATACLIWPVWHYAFPDAKWIIVRRRTGDIITSCIKTGFMRAFSRTDIQGKVEAKNEKEGWLWWVHQHEKRFVEMITEGVNVKVIWPERMVYGDYRQLYETLDWLGLEWNSKALSFIDPLLWHVRRKEARKKPG